ncbi:MAG: hypothetical protein LBJ84_02115, partial [Oscillospiraceae bacterium]|nr:hypothetical protein [Oscillospiraceae bacterium]
KALGRRAALDISKRGIMLNRFGLGSRAYANQGARDDLTDDFVNNGAVSLDSADCHNALRACFSAQIDDSADFKESVSGDVKALAAGSTRNTALDWKLFGRALQFVRRTRDERKMFLEDRTLYNTSGDVATRGEFEYSSGNLRQNVHNAGNRFTRFLGRRVADRLKDQIPAPVLMAVRAALPIKYANKLAKLEFMESEDNSILETAMGVVEAVNEQAEGVPDKVEGLSGIMGAFGLDAAADKTSGFSEAIAGPMETVTGAIGNVKTAYDAISTLYSAGKAIRDSHKTAKDAEEAKKRDELKLATAESERSQLSKDEEEQLKNSLERNRKAANRGQKLAANRKIDEIVNSTAELLGAALEEALEPTLDALPIKLPIAAAVEEAGHFINFIRGYIEDRTNVTEYFNSQSEAEMLKNKLKETADLQLDEKDLEAFDKDKNEMMRRGMGYENYTEMASVVGLSITRSLLFSAGEQGPIEENRIRAVAVLVMLDCKELMGKHDAESAEKLYSAIMASDYR